MKILKSLLRISLALAAAAALSLASTAWAQVDLTRMAWVGDSEGAGFSAYCLTKRVQVDSPGAIIARTNGVDYQQPIVNDPGIGGCYKLVTLAPSFIQEPSTGTPANLALPRPYNNLSVGGCKIHDMLAATTGAEVDHAGTCRDTIDLVLRNSALHLGSMVDQAIALNPTFVFLENVGNDNLLALLDGNFIDGVTITPVASFAADTNAALAKLKAKQPNGIVFGTVDVTNIPFATTLPYFLTSGGKPVLNPATGAVIPLLGPKGCGAAPACPIPAGTLVTLSAGAYLPLGYGIPCAVAPTLPKCNNPLPAAPIDASHPGVLIYAADVALLKQRTADYNTAVKAAAASSGYKYYDSNDFFLRMKAGFDIGGITINAAYLTGGAFSYDAYHLTPIGYALLADDLTQFMNANFNAGLPRVNLTTYLFNGGTNGGLSGSSALYAPLNGEDFQRAVQAIFTPDFARELASGISFSKPTLVQGDSGPVQRVEPHHRGLDPQ